MNDDATRLYEYRKSYFHGTEDTQVHFNMELLLDMEVKSKGLEVVQFLDMEQEEAGTLMPFVESYVLRAEVKEKV